MLKMICTEKEAIYQTDFKQAMIIKDYLNVSQTRDDGKLCGYFCNHSKNVAFFIDIM